LIEEADEKVVWMLGLDVESASVSAGKSLRL